MHNNEASVHRSGKWKGSEPVLSPSPNLFSVL